MFVFGIIFLIVAIILIGIGIAFGVAIFALAGIAIGLGVTSSSIAIGFIQRKPSLGLRAFFYQLFVIIFSLLGILSTWAISTFSGYDFSFLSIALIGALSGTSIGLLFAVFHSWIIDLIGSSLRRLFSQHQKSTEQGAAANP
jgi:hypothetical protein